MADTYTTRNRVTKIENGTRDGTWGTGLNQEVIDIFDEALDGITIVDVSAGDVTLSAANGVTDEARQRILRVTGAISSARTITIPDVEKWYIIEMATTGTGSVIFKNVSDTNGVTVSAGSPNTSILCDGTSTRSWVTETDGSIYVQIANNLSDLTNTSAARDNLGLGIVAEATVSSNNILLGTGAGGAVTEITASDGVTVSSGTLKADVAAAGTPGVIQVATTAETFTGTETGKAITPASFAGNTTVTSAGQINYPGGLIEKWGKETGISATGSARAVAFTSAFPTAALNVSLTTTIPSGAAGSNNNAVAIAVGLSASGFRVAGDNVTAAVSIDVYWRVLGY